MKKLLVVLGAVALAVNANAATVTWNSGVLKTPTTSDGGWSTSNITSGSATGYFWVIDAATYGSLYSEDAATVQANVIAQYATINDGMITAKSGYNTPTAATTLITYKDDGGYNAGDTAYAAMLFVYTDADSGDQYYIANVGSYTFASATSRNVGNMALNVNSSGAPIGGWTAAPEPTSGLLMLLGMAGLALRRRRA